MTLVGITFDVQNQEVALVYAASSGRIDCVRLLLESGVDKNAQCSVRVGGAFRLSVFVLFLLDYFYSFSLIAKFSSDM